MPGTVAIVNHRFANLAIEEEVLAGYRLMAVQGRTEQEVLAVLSQADAILITSTPRLTAAGIAALQRCRAIVRYGIGVDNVDLAAATARGILVCNVPDYCWEEVSNHAITLALACSRKLLQAVQGVRDGRWSVTDLAPIRETDGQLFGLIGLGKIARRVAAKARVFGFQVAAYDPYVSADEMAAEGVQKCELDALLASADILSLHVPLTPYTQAMIGAAQLRAMKPTAYLINTARAALVDEAALIQALDEAWIAGAALDMLAEEPPRAGHPLVGRPNVIVTPHAGWYSEGAIARLQRRAAEQVRLALAGEVPPFALNKR